jgi:hypothetical protein
MKRLGKKWSLMVVPWVQSSYFKQPCPNVDATQDEMFTTEEANRLRMIQELYDFVPSEFHFQLEHKNVFAQLVYMIFILKNNFSLIMLTYSSKMVLMPNVLPLLIVLEILLLLY